MNDFHKHWLPTLFFLWFIIVFGGLCAMASAWLWVTA